MNASTIDTLRVRVTQMNARYDAYFAGQPRHSRDPSMLDELIDEASSVAESASAIGTDEAAAVGQGALESAAMYKREAEAIRGIQEGSTEIFLAHEYRAWSRMTFERYHRNFAGQSRQDRNLSTLRSMIEELDQLDDEMAKLEAREQDAFISDARAELERNRTLYRDELTTISSLRSSGEQGERADYLASAANTLFEDYARFFAKKQRRSRSLTRLRGMIDELKNIHDQMNALKAAGFENDSNSRNSDIVADRIRFYEREWSAIQESRREGSFDELVTSLGAAANQVFSQYRTSFAGQDRATRDLVLLGTLCDELHDLARQMDQLDRVRDNDQNQHNLAVVLDQLRTYSREFREIRKMKASS